MRLSLDWRFVENGEAAPWSEVRRSDSITFERSELLLSMSLIAPHWSK